MVPNPLPSLHTASLITSSHASHAHFSTNSVQELPFQLSRWRRCTSSGTQSLIVTTAKSLIQLYQHFCIHILERSIPFSTTRAATKFHPHFLLRNSTQHEALCSSSQNSLCCSAASIEMRWASDKAQLPSSYFAFPLCGDGIMEENKITGVVGQAGDEIPKPDVRDWHGSGREFHPVPPTTIANCTYTVWLHCHINDSLSHQPLPQLQELWTTTSLH